MPTIPHALPSRVEPTPVSFEDVSNVLSPLDARCAHFSNFFLQSYGSVLIYAQLEVDRISTWLCTTGPSRWQSCRVCSLHSLHGNLDIVGIHKHRTELHLNTVDRTACIFVCELSSGWIVSIEMISNRPIRWRRTEVVLSPLKIFRIVLYLGA